MVQMKLENVSKKLSMELDIEVADSNFSRMRGLMFRNKIIPILFIFGYEGRFPIHSYFVYGLFDAIYVGSDGTVVELFRKIEPNTSRVSPKRMANFLIELPVEVTDNLQITEGDKLKWARLGES